MEYFVNEIWPYIVALVLVTAIYWSIEKLFSRLLPNVFKSNPARIIKNSKIATTVVNTVKPEPVFAFEFREVAGEDAMAAFESAKTEGKGIPVLINGGENFRKSLSEAAAFRKPSTEDYLRMATAKPDPYATKSKPRVPERWQDAGSLVDDGQPFLIKNYPTGFKPVVTLAFIPAQSSAEIPAHLKLGGWNGVAEADISVALFRKWQRDYGAEIVAISLDAIDVRVQRQPKTRQDAMSLAREHKKFCDSGATLAETAAELMATNWWHFYWD